MRESARSPVLHWGNSAIIAIFVVKMIQAIGAALAYGLGCLDGMDVVLMLVSREGIEPPTY